MPLRVFVRLNRYCSSASGWLPVSTADSLIGDNQFAIHIWPFPRKPHGVGPTQRTRPRGDRSIARSLPAAPQIRALPCRYWTKIQMAAAAWHGPSAAYASSPNSLLLSRPPPHAPSPATSMRRRIVLGVGVGTPAVAALAAAATPAVLQDGAATLFVTAGAYALVRTFDVLTERRLIDQSLSRKIVHVLSGVLFMSSWPLFSNSTEARYFAAVVPFLNSMRLLTYGLRIYTDEALVKSVTREGKPEELLRGPLYYVLVLLFSVLVFWRESLIGVVSLSMMSGGDGFADIIGRRYGSVKLPFNAKKSWIGSLSMFISGFLLSAIMLFYFSSLGYIHVSWEDAFAKLALVALTATIVECIPVTDVIDDNISVPLATMLVAFLLFGSNTQ